MSLRQAGHPVRSHLSFLDLEVTDCYKDETDFIKQFGWFPDGKLSTWAYCVG